MRQPSSYRLGVVAAAVAAAGCLQLAGCSRGRAVAPEPHAADPTSQRTIASGELVGFAAKDGRSQAWLGIPFAKPPVGDLRWQPPEPPESWTGVREALRFGSACPQMAGTLGDDPDAPKGSVIGHEDCLYLNVYAPRGTAAEAAGRHLPVMVWFHGGGNSVGHAGTYDGSELAARYDLVVVTTNYRLGPFGWFRHPALVAGAEGDAQSGNWGTLDLVRSLEWVRENIAAFGGDPGNVTIFGESAGGTDVFSLLVSPRAAGLFQRAISESGGTRSRSLAEAENRVDAAQPGEKNSSAEAALRILFPGVPRVRALEQAKDLSDAEIASRLRAASPDAVLGAYRGDEEAFGGMLDVPAVLRDGSTLPRDEAMKLFAEGRYNQVPVILGTNRDELKLFIFRDPELVHWWFGVLPRARDENRYEITSDYASLGWKIRGADDPAAAMRRVQGPSVYVYRFDWDEEPKFLWSDFGKLLGAAHGMEIPFVFARFETSAFGPIFTDANRPGREELANAMSSYWANFAYTGAPGRGRDGKLPEWKAVDPAPGGQKQIVFDTTAGGGVRMDGERVTKQSLLARLASDPRTDEKLRCETFQDMVEHHSLVAADRTAAGCSEQGLKEVAKR